MGKVVSGLATFSKYRSSDASIVVFPGNFSWPLGLFMPDRCFHSVSFFFPAGKKLFIINTHNSAFDDGTLRNEQMSLLYDYMESLIWTGIM